MIIGAAATARASQTVSLPITIDYSLLRTLVVEQAFPEKGASATLVNEGAGCVRLVLADPRINEKNGLMRLEMKIFARLGTPFGNNCYAPLEWQGILVLYKRPKLNPGSWQLSFSLVDAELLSSDRNPVQIANLLWGMIQQQALSYIDDIVIDLMPPVTELKHFLFPLFPERVRQNTEHMLASLRPGDVRVHQDGLALSVLADVQNIYDPNDNQLQVPLEGKSLERLIALWENWDGLLMYLVAVISRESLSVDEQHILRNVLLDSRYQFIQAQTDKGITRDFIREQFVYAWEQLGPVFKKHLAKGQDGARTLGYLAFISSADALLVFDKLGPTFGLEISRNGLIRLIDMLDGDPQLLFHPSRVSPELQKLFQMTPTEPDRQDNSSFRNSHDTEDETVIDTLIRPFLFVASYFQPADAHAALPTFQEILRWKVPKDNISGYIQNVSTLLEKSSNDRQCLNTVPGHLQPMFHRLIKAMAWQESCFRQFVVKGKKLTYLLSYNNSSVGLMQVNERVWRGLFNRDSLRWDIGYNAAAGCRITALYLDKYVLGDELAKGMDDNTIARLVYAMYNGGPSQRQKFIARLKNKRLYKSDKLFWQKYQWVLSGNSDKLSRCLVGG